MRASRRWSTRWSAPGSPSPVCSGRPPARRCWCTTPRTPSGSARTGCCPTSSGSTCSTNDPDSLQLVPVRGARGPGHPRRPRHRLGRGAQPHAGRPAARCRRPLAVRHVCCAVRRPGAVGLPEEGGRAVHRRRDRARPHAARRRRDGLHPSGADAGQPRAEGLAAVHGHRGRGRRDGLLPPEEVADIRGWLEALAADADARAAVVKQTLDGAVRTAPGTPTRSPTRSSSRSRPSRRLREDADRAYDEALEAIPKATADGTLLRGEVLARWQEFVGTGELLQRWSPGSAALATASSTPSRESRSRSSG